MKNYNTLDLFLHAIEEHQKTAGRLIEQKVTKPTKIPAIKNISVTVYYVENGMKTTVAKCDGNVNATSESDVKAVTDNIYKNIMIELLNTYYK